MAHSQEKRWNRFQKKKYGYSICVYAMLFIIGWIRGLFGPSFIDLQLISDVTLKLGSWISTVNFIGYALGCVTGGFLYDKINRNIFYGTGLLLIGIVTAGVPWCFVFVLMAAAHFCQGFASGMVDTVGNAEMMQMWSDKKMMYFFMEFSYSVGVFIAPLVVAPFLSDYTNDISTHQHMNSTFDNVTYLHNISSISTVSSNIQFQSFGRAVNSTFGNETTGNVTKHTERPTMTSRLFIPYSISAVLAVLVCLPFFILHFMRYMETNDDITEVNDTTKEMKQSSADDRTIRVLPTKLKVVCLVLICSLMFMGISLGEGYISFIVVYCVEEIGFSPTDGALVSAVSNVCCIVAIVVAIFVSRFNTLVYLGIHIVGTSVGVTALLFSSIGQSNLGVWISSAMVGYFRSMIFSLTFTWTNNYITPTTGKVASLFMLCTCSGSAVIPLLLGWLMEEYTNLWFCFLLIIFGVCTLILYIIGMVLTRYVTTLYGKTYDRIAVHDIYLTERLNDEVDGIDVAVSSK
ncbi:sodium-dependent glucose transporter 1B-like [Mizuhopecten yessoensis]|uniref:Sodium-dependent glucose transporter 1 n=1 Tax=Mizuhopecten yessoensis TaxID=6573 RepID=A0A210PU17_MIZYE|nr:sodium-dependent glucose transporter 1B-like [Mizuhopecten yessoensis]XP_021375237.1 sodium-dependent glucose transporter 1B-like [Mizuhopecten yessoensis]XP_021375238.1 sodium-dependent glucose transporter 1B-like [Mizuhopecten yessoensis]OWF40000.1 Sodium-dependent glucose transporter 1 [Mizuhopecten yessoensis]